MTGRRVLDVIMGVLLFIVIGVGIVYLLGQNVAAVTDVFRGNVSKQPINVTSPVYGQIMDLSVKPGQNVKKGQLLATIHIINIDTPLPEKSDIYHVDHAHLTLQLFSPQSGMVGSVPFAKLSTIAGSATLLQLFAVEDMSIQVLVPEDKNIRDYTALYAGHPSEQTRYRLTIGQELPNDILPNIDPTLSVYSATCSRC